MAATIALPPDITERIRLFVAEGDYPDAESAIREAFQLLEDQREMDWFKQSIEEARRSRAEGRSLPWNEETISRIWQEGLDMYHNGIAPDPDVCPE